MIKGLKIPAGLSILLAILLSSCSNEPKENKDSETIKIESDRGEHSGEKEDEHK